MDTQKRVWNRVKAPMEPVNSGLVSPLWQDARSRADFYRQQMKNGSAARQKLFTELYNRETAICRSLAGIQLLRTGKPIRQTQPVAVPGDGLKRCYYATSRFLSEVTARSLEPEFGTVYRELANLATAQLLDLTQAAGIT